VQNIQKSLVASLFAVAILTAGCGAIAQKAKTTTAAPEAAASPAILTQPASTTVTAGLAATFSVTASGASTLSYQWQKNGATISGATGASYTTPPTTAAMLTSAGSSGSAGKVAEFTVVVSNEAGSVTSNPASLTVAAAGTLVLKSSASILNFGKVSVASRSSQSITLTNAGNANVTIYQVLVAGAGFNASGSNGTTLAPGESTTLTSTFEPSASGTATGQVTVSSSAANSPTDISLTGTGIPSDAAHYVDLSWAGGAAGVTGFNAYSSTSANGPFAKLNAAPLTSSTYTDNSVQAGQTYYYVVTALNAANEESKYSSDVTAIVP
jgi:Abnormal spindle-like microcephaly-assoc'd, ASPM-SPD-2-Hydin/Immunoglobulin I-set domain